MLVSCFVIASIYISISDYLIALKRCIFCQEHPLLSARFLQKSPSLSDFSQEIFVYMQKK